MMNSFTRYRALTLAAALALPTWALAQQAPSQALEVFAAKARAQGLSAADVANPLVTSSYTEAGNGVTHTYLLQRVNGVPVFGATGAIHTDRSGGLVGSYQEFTAGAAASAPSARPTLGAADAVAAASTALGLGRPTGLQQLGEANQQGIITFNEGSIAQDKITVQLMYTRTSTGLVLVWNVTLAQNDQEHYWNARVDAHTGRLVDKNDFTVNEQATFNGATLRTAARKQRALAFAHAAAPASVLSPTSTTAAGAVTAFAFPLESPAQGARTNVTLPAPGSAAWSPYGWAVGQSFSTYTNTFSRQSSGKFLTRGNNVAAYDDNSATANGPTAANLNSDNTSPDGGSTLNYEFPFVQASGPRANIDATVTNLFYVNNMMHDVMMAHGFDEVSGNFQFKNSTSTGVGGDYVRAEAQDGYARNNANFSTPADGGLPTMQMYLWDNIDQALTITAPSSIAGRFNYVATTSFGGDVSSFPTGLCASIVPVNDGTGVDGGIHSCSANYTNAAAVNGNIALIQRAGCSSTALNAFVVKVKNAQLNGAIAAIVYDSDVNGTTYVNMGGTDPDITIPAVFIRGVDGARIRAALTGSNVATGCLTSITGADWDGSFDNGVVSHEYGHGISGRITGGPANSSCTILSYTSGTTTMATQVMGEGWSDFFGLWMTTKPGEDGGRARGIGNYVIGEDPTTGRGIRTYPYSTNMTINPLTYGMIGTAPYTETHNIGEIWTAMIWDLNWQLIAKYGYNANQYASTGGNNVALKLILDGMRYQTCNPSFLSGRNGILKADSINNGGANKALIWTVFARRGLGYSAKAGDRGTVSGVSVPLLTNIVAATNMPPGLSPVSLSTRAVNNASALEAYPNPTQNLLTVRSQVSSAAPVRVTLYDLLGKAVLPAVSVPAAQLQQAGATLDTSMLADGVYIVHVATTEGSYTTRVTVQH